MGKNEYHTLRRCICVACRSMEFVRVCDLWLVAARRRPDSARLGREGVDCGDTRMFTQYDPNSGFDTGKTRSGQG